jgi:hypothetical protein
MAGSGFSYYATNEADLSDLGRLIPNLIEIDSSKTSNTTNPTTVDQGKGYFIALPNYYHKVRYAYNNFSSNPTDQIRIILPPSGQINKGKWLAIEDTHGVGVFIIGSPSYVQFPFIGGNGNRTRTYFHCNGESWIQINLMPISAPNLSDYEIITNKELLVLDNSITKFPNNNVVKTALDAFNASLLANCNDIRNTYLAKANNLSDLSNLALARQNLGVEGLDKKGVANGYPSLDASGTIPSAQLPSYVDDVLEYATVSAFPSVGVSGKIYLVTTGVDSNKSYRWSGSTYIELISSPGSTDAIAEGTVNKYWTNARTLASSLAGFVVSAYTAITSADTVLSAFQKIQGFFNSLSTVAFSGNYNDLINKPIIPSGSSLDKYYSTINRCSITGSTTSLGTAWIIPFTPLADMSITQIGCLLTNVNASERVDMAIYNSTLTTNLGTSFTTFSTTGEKFVTLATAVSLVGGTQYYLVLKGDNFGANNYAYTSCFSNSLIARQVNLGAGAITGSLAGAGASTVVPFISIK